MAQPEYIHNIEELAVLYRGAIGVRPELAGLAEAAAFRIASAEAALAEADALRRFAAIAGE